MSKEIKHQARQQGLAIEKLAANYLRQQGVIILEKNVSCRHGEIDIIGQHDQTLIFVEVRYRQYHQFGSGAESVNRHKQQKLVKTAQTYLQAKKLTNSVSCRFDVISVSPTAKGGDTQKYQLDWIVNAFDINT